jgi:molecular chaperone GrpE
MKEASDMINQKITELNTKHQQETLEAKKYLLAKFLEQLVEIIDQLEKVINMPIADPKITNYQLGFKMYLSMLFNLLSDNQVSQIKVNIGDRFDEKTMSVCEVIIDQSKQPDTVAVIISNAYKLNDRIIKPAVVKVYKKQ